MKINDVGGQSTTETGTTTVADAPLTAGTITITGAVEDVTAGTLSATFTDANTAAQTSDFSGTIDWGDGSAIANFTSADVTGSNGSYTVSGSHLYVEDGNYTPIVHINDAGGSKTTDSDMVTVADAPLTAGAITTITGGVEGVTPATLIATFFDANKLAPTSDFSGTITWGDGAISYFTSADVSGSNGNYTITDSHLYAEEGTDNVSVAIKDVGGSTTADTGNTTVADAPLTPGAAVTLNGAAGTALTATVATFTDANPNAPLSDFTATINWGDTTSSTGTITETAGGVFSVAGNHTYGTSGAYNATVTINDVGGSFAVVTDTIDVVPGAPVIANVVGQPLNGGTVDLQGTGEVGDTVNLFADGNMGTIVGSGTVLPDGSFDITTTATFTDGVHSFTATEIDAAHLTSPTSTAFPVDVAPTLSAGGTGDLCPERVSDPARRHRDGRPRRPRRAAHRRHGIDRHRLLPRRRPELHQPERNHRQLQCRERRVDADGLGQRRRLQYGARQH